MKLTKCGENVRETASKPQEKKGIYKSRGLNKCGIPLRVKSFKLSQIKKIVYDNYYTTFN